MAQVSKKPHFPILNCPWANSINTCLQPTSQDRGQGLLFLVLSRTASFPLQCGANSELQCRHQLGPARQKSREIHTATSCHCPSSSCHCQWNFCCRQSNLLSGMDWLEGHLTGFGTKVSFCLVLFAFWLLFGGGGSFCHCTGSIAPLIFFPPVLSLCSPLFTTRSGEGGLSAVLPLSLGPHSLLQSLPS